MSKPVPARYRLPTNMPPEVVSVITHYANAHGTTVDAILRGCRTQRVGFARRMICERLRAKGHSLPQIGRWLRLHHTSVLYQLRRGDGCIRGRIMPAGLAERDTARGAAVDLAKTSAERWIKCIELEQRQQRLVEALKALKDDYAASAGCYCGEIVGGTDSEGLPLGKCGYCLAAEALREIGEQEKAG